MMTWSEPVDELRAVCWRHRRDMTWFALHRAAGVAGPWLISLVWSSDFLARFESRRLWN